MFLTDMIFHTFWYDISHQTIWFFYITPLDTNYFIW